MPEPSLDKYGIFSELEEKCIVPNVLGRLSRGQQEALSLLAVTVSYCAEAFKNRRGVTPLGLSCALPAAQLRNFIMACMTANAALEAEETNQRDPVVMELGYGTGLNLLAAKLVCYKAFTTGYEQDPLAQEFAGILEKVYGLKIDRKGGDFLAAHLAEASADVIVNENIHTLLTWEPQLLAARAARKAAHAKTLFVPGGMDFYLRTNDISFYMGRVDFGKVDSDSIRLAAEVPGNLIGRSVLISPMLLNHRMHPIFKNPGIEIGGIRQ
ncbi:hypothetical protein HYY74_08300 [Candidatus Woesearchaeota archaeon]|nr:hypothetical protein [Candidatus Woesearchaeota archaeon]